MRPRDLCSRTAPTDIWGWAGVRSPVGLRAGRCGSGPGLPVGGRSRLPAAVGGTRQKKRAGAPMQGGVRSPLFCLPVYFLLGGIPAGDALKLILDGGFDLLEGGAEGGGQLFAEQFLRPLLVL